jgi:hypothetical protein
MMVLRKLKERVKKIVPLTLKKKSAVKTPAVRRKKGAASASVALAQKEAVLGMQEMAVGKTKFFTPSAPRETRRQMVDELPGAYHEDKIVLQIRDPWWLHSYWEASEATIEKLHREQGQRLHGARMVVRVYDVSHIAFNGKNAHSFHDIEVGYHAKSWYINVAPGRSWIVDLGLLLANGEFLLIARSNTVYTPLEGPSWVTDEEWMIPEEMFARLYGMGFGFGQSSPVGKAWQERMRRALFSGVLASPGMASMSSPAKKAPKGQRKFWMVVNTELIVYGATEPDATVTVQGKEIKLRPDGTFSLRFALPDGTQVIPVKGVAADKLEERLITPIVSRETK